MSSCPTTLSHTIRWGTRLIVISAAVLHTANGLGQRVRFPSPAGPDPYPGAIPGTISSGSITSGTNPSTAPWIPTTPPTSGAALGGQILPFDPYALPSQTAPPAFGGVPSVPPAPPAFPPGGTTTNIPQVVVPNVPPPAYPPPGFGNPAYPANVPPALPGVPRPAPLNGSIYGPDWGYGYTSPLFPNGLPWNQPAGGPYQRLFQDTGARYTYLWGDDKDNSLEINEIDLSTTVVIQNFARSATGLRITPGFVFDFLAGPSGASHLPPQLYSAYLDAAWRPQIRPQFAADLAVRTGVYSDFESVTSDSVRITGYGLGVIQLTPTTALKLGVEYLDRLDIKLLPGIGVYWEPNPQTRCDLYFPRPKIARYWSTLGNHEVWWHIGAEYGGGSWVFERDVDPLLGRSEQADINDIRIFTGIDWSYLDQRSGFFQIGYVFDREIVYRLVPAENISLDDTFMIRLGLRF